MPNIARHGPALVRFCPCLTNQTWAQSWCFKSLQNTSAIDVTSHITLIHPSNTPICPANMGTDTGMCWFSLYPGLGNQRRWWKTIISASTETERKGFLNTAMYLHVGNLLVSNMPNVEHMLRPTLVRILGGLQNPSNPRWYLQKTPLKRYYRFMGSPSPYSGDSWTREKVLPLFKNKCIKRFCRSLIC